MAHIFQKGEKFAQTGLGLLKKNARGIALFKTRYGIADFKGSLGDVVNIKRPATLRARDKGWRNDNKIIFDRLVQSKIQVRLNLHPYSAVELSPEEETLDEVEYVRDVQAPQVAALGEYFEELWPATLRVADFVLEVGYNPSSTTAKLNDPRKVASRANRLFTESKVPALGRYWLVGSEVAEAIRDFDKLLDVDTSGLPEALREGVVTKLSSFFVIEMDSLNPDESYFVHETAIAIANVAPVVPQGVTKGGGVATANGLSLTQLWDYDSDYLKDRSIVHTFAGATVVTDPETDADGMIVLDDSDEPQFEFVRAIKVIFGATATDNSAFTVAITGVPTGGTFKLVVDGTETDAIPHDASNAAIAAAINAIEGVSGARVTGAGASKTVKFTEVVTLVKGTTALTGGTSPNVTVSA